MVTKKFGSEREARNLADWMWDEGYRSLQVHYVDGWFVTYEMNDPFTDEVSVVPMSIGGYESLKKERELTGK